MTAPTHAAFGVLVAALFDAGTYAGVCAAFGALLPDIDHDQSAIGRFLWFLSIPIKSRFGHRGFVHSLTIWIIPLCIAVMIGNKALLWVSTGCISHCILDTFNKSGVRLFVPFSSITVVCPAEDKYRIKTASVGEIYVFIIIIGFVFITGYGNSLGGVKKLINAMVHSAKITEEEYIRAGTERCHVKGDFRWKSGIIEKGVLWLVVGTEDMSNLPVYWNGSKLIKARHGEFIRSELRQSGKPWNPVKIAGFAKPRIRVFYFEGREWHKAEPGELAFGWIKPLDEVPLELDIIRQDGIHEGF